MGRLWTPPSSRGATEVAPGVEVQPVAGEVRPGVDDVLFLPPKDWGQLKHNDGRTIPSMITECEQLRQPVLDGQAECEYFGLLAGFGVDTREQTGGPLGYLRLKVPLMQVAFFTRDAPEGWVEVAEVEGFAIHLIDPATGDPDAFMATGKMQQRFDKPLWTPGRRQATKPGRNEPCTCGSGLKFKRCCGA